MVTHCQPITFVRTVCLIIYRCFFIFTLLSRFSQPRLPNSIDSAWADHSLMCLLDDRTYSIKVGRARSAYPNHTKAFTTWLQVLGLHVDVAGDVQ
jgi:hypothetical protein